MQFQEVTVLVPGTKYKIIHYQYPEYIATYKKSPYYPIIYTFSTKEKNYHHYKTSDFVPYKYYVPILKTKEIQSEMERRAVNLILRNLTGDSTFTW